MAASPAFGTCCEDLRQAMHSKTNSMFQVDDGLLFLNICMVPMEGKIGYFTKPVRFCPFCGAQLQSTEVVAAWGKTA
jgi:hypothetical protein